MLHKKINDKEADEMRKNYYHFVDKRKKIMMITQFEVEDVTKDKLGKESIWVE